MVSSPAEAPEEALVARVVAMPANPRLQRTRSAPLRSPLSRKPFGAAVKIRAGRSARRRAWRRAAQAMRSSALPRFNGRPHGLNARPGTLRG